ncbi:MAG: hypothetical protein ACLQT7_10430 [Candidatus Dormibacteria bacterium]
MSDQAVAGPEPDPAAGDPTSPAPDLEGIVAGVSAEVERGRAAGAYPASLVERLATPFHPDEGLEAPEASVLIESARPLRAGRPVIGGVAVLVKRVTRRLLSWYVAPIARDQTRFNLAMLRELRALEGRVARLEASAPEPADPEGSESREA